MFEAMDGRLHRQAFCAREVCRSGPSPRPLRHSWHKNSAVARMACSTGNKWDRRRGTAREKDMDVVSVEDLSPAYAD